MRVGAVLLTGLGLVAGAAGAEPPAPSVAKQVKEAEGLYQTGKYDAAATLLKTVYAREPNPVLLYNIARAYDQAGELKEALDYYQRYVGSAQGTDPQLLKRSALASERLRALIDKDEAARRKQEEDQRRSDAEAQAARERSQQEAADALHAQKVAEARSRAAAEAVAASQRSRRIGAWIAGGVGLAAVGTGVFFGLNANAAYNGFKTAPTVDRKDAQEAQTRNNAIAADVSFAVGAAAFATAALLYPKGAEPTLAVVPSAGGATLVGRF
jgi:tetratricopeptide (TPR) repeat protein